LTSEGIQSPLQLSASAHRDKEGSQCPARKAHGQ